ncbi:hypothetical protein [Olleya marilimosa]|uniref:Zinc-binding domain-containing protein n=1 Tax=Olleya marilimosa TaxID=272164 RepID=A0ABR8LX10_9FLAO|nr:hypothetical protein [Olleya marilimosa]MBD3864707.1 hypothetical protein [Olleya marilimosa]
MCRYGFNNTYKPHYACFNCRKSFKRRLFEDIYDNNNQIKKKAKCPECQSLMADMGLDFKAPKITDRKAWTQLSLLFEVGLTFHGCGCSSLGQIPKDKKELIIKFETQKKDYERHLKYWIKKSENPTNNKYKTELSNEFEWGTPVIKNSEDTQQNSIEYWKERIIEIENQITIANKV